MRWSSSMRRYGIGNGRVIPGGPLRANIVDQLVFTMGF